MDAPLTPVDPIAEPVRTHRWGELAGSFVTALVLNGLLLGLLLFITVGESRRTPPAIYATSIPEPEDTPIESPPLQQPKPSIQGGGSSAPSAALAITLTATSGPSMTLPDLPSTDNGVSGLAGIGNGFGSGFGSGLGAGSGTGNGTGSMMVGKITVKAAILGVILDVSGSMEDELPKVKREVRRAFRRAETVEVMGCRLDWVPQPDADPGKARLSREARSVIEAVEMLVVAGKVDAIYWFSDLQDGESEAGLARLRELLRVGQGKAKAVRFYIRSLGREPSPELTEIVMATGGATQAGETGEKKAE